MSELPAGTQLDMNNITLRIALDITGLVGFAKDFETCNTFKDADTDELFNIIKISEPPRSLLPAQHCSLCSMSTHQWSTDVID